MTKQPIIKMTAKKNSKFQQREFYKVTQPSDDVKNIQRKLS